MPATSSAAYSFDAIFNGTWSATPLTIVICASIAGYNAIEGLLLILSTFKQYRGLYFWALIVAAAGIIVYMIAVVLWYFALTNRLVALLLLYIGWVTMVTGQSVVLYSRLGIIMGSERERILRMVKWMIIVDAVVFHTTTIVISLCSFYAPNPEPASRAYHYIERLQITAFGIQELIISGIYIWRTLEILRTSVRAQHRRIVIELLTINLVLVIIDTVTVTLEYCNLFFFEVAFKMLSYSIKLKLEFAVLNKLMALSGVDESVSYGRGGSMTIPINTISDAGDTYRPRSVSLAYHEPPVHARKHQVDVIESGGTTLVERHHSQGIQLEELAPERRDSFVNYADILRSLSKG